MDFKARVCLKACFCVFTTLVYHLVFYPPAQQGLKQGLAPELNVAFWLQQGYDLHIFLLFI